MRKIKGYGRTYFVVLVIVNESQKKNTAVLGDSLFEELVESGLLLLLSHLEFVVLVVLRLAKDFVGHRAEVVGQSVDDFRVLVALQASKVGHIDENEVVDLDTEMAAFLDELSQCWLLLGQFAHQTALVSQRFTDLHAYFSIGLVLAVEFPVVKDEFLVLEEHCDPEKSNWVLDVFDAVLDQRGGVH